jgi:hypothetical protein
MPVTISKPDIERLERDGILAEGQSETVWSALSMSETPPPETGAQPRAAFDATNVLLYFGALVVISAMTWFMTSGWERFEGGGLLGIALGYATLFWIGGAYLTDRLGSQTAGGLLFVLAVCMTPIGVYDVQVILGLWPFDEARPSAYADYYEVVRANWIVIELATLAAGLLAIWRRSFTFLAAPVAFTLWFLSMDLTAVIFGLEQVDFDHRRLVSLWFGLAVLVGSYLIDRRTRADYAFWGYFFGMLAFWGGLTFTESESELAKFAYFLVNVVLIGLGVALQRRVFAVFGGIGALVYFGHLAGEVFEDSLRFPFAMVFLGLSIMALGYVVERNRERLANGLNARIPDRYADLLPQNRRYGSK